MPLLEVSSHPITSLRSFVYLSVNHTTNRRMVSKSLRGWPKGNCTGLSKLDIGVFAVVLSVGGGVSEWFKETVLKTVFAFSERGFESHPLR